MGDLQPTAVLTPGCTVCAFPNWNMEMELIRPDEFGCYEQRIEEYESLQGSMQLGCPGCILLHEAWAYCVPDELCRSKASLSINVDTSKMYFHFFDGSVHDMDIFTLPGTSDLLYDNYYFLQSQANLVSNTSLALL
jgi:hypothetical protein